MCSIAGVYYFEGSKANICNLCELVKNALELLKNRGPDESSVETIGNNCVMGGNRLIIRGDVGEGSMPFKYKDNVCFYNGEIYNYTDLNRECLYSDGEILLPLYEEQYLDMFNKLDGEFAISIWDNQRKALILARDPFGTKPIYFSLNDKRLLWGSSATAINKMEQHDLCSSFKSPVYKHTYSIQEPYTSYSGIWLIPPGHCLIIKDNYARLHCYNAWEEGDLTETDTTALFKALNHSLETRLEYDGVIGIPMSAGVDSGIIAFAADQMNIQYHIFSMVEMFGKETSETTDIYRRLDRLKNFKDVTLLKCNDEEFNESLREMFLPDYYDSEEFGTGNVATNVVFKSMKSKNIRVAIDGSGGDELFHGYLFREDFEPVEKWPLWWDKCNYFYSIFTTLLDYTRKVDRAGAHFSIETRYPFQTVDLMKIALSLKISNKLKWPLRKYLLEELNYGQPMEVDLNKKFGFSLKNREQSGMINEMMKAWCNSKGISKLPQNPPKTFPFHIGK